MPEHDHDFYECSWVDSGVIQHQCNASLQDLHEGDVVLLRPCDRHTLSGHGVLTTVSMPPSLHDQLRHAARDWQLHWPWNDDPQPQCRHLASSDLHQLHRTLSQLPMHEQRPIDGVCFFLNLLRLLDHAPAAHEAPPDWLLEAIETFQQPQHLALGVNALVALCKRSPAHVCRVVRRCFSCTPTELANTIRLDHVARELRFGHATVLDIALQAGFSNQGHFHRLFRQRFAQTPLQFRKLPV